MTEIVSIVAGRFKFTFYFWRISKRKKDNVIRYTLHSYRGYVNAFIDIPPLSSPEMPKIIIPPAETELEVATHIVIPKSMGARLKRELEKYVKKSSEGYIGGREFG